MRALYSQGDFVGLTARTHTRTDLRPVQAPRSLCVPLALTIAPLV